MQSRSLNACFEWAGRIPAHPSCGGAAYLPAYMAGLVCGREAQGLPGVRLRLLHNDSEHRGAHGYADALDEQKSVRSPLFEFCD